MRANRSRDTKPELAIRRLLWSRGFRYRVCARPIPSVRRTVDIVFGPSRVAVEVRGCFWHGCPEHYRAPARNDSYWSAKVARNQARDADTEQLLRDAGWLLIVAWEHDDPAQVADEVAMAVERRRRGTKTVDGQPPPATR
jgi:DNA mismatch endonuclease (patch repair protein)